jgi:formate hydrogenlyase transcriptional activator
MQVLFKIPGALREFTGNQSAVRLDVEAGANLLQVLQALFVVYPGLRDRVLTETGETRRHVNIFCGQRGCALHRWPCHGYSCRGRSFGCASDQWWLRTRASVCAILLVSQLTSGWFMAHAKASPNPQALPTSRSSAQTLPSDAVLDALKMILLGAPLNEVLTTITRLIEAHSEGMLWSIFLVEEDGLHLRYSVAEDLPETYRAATDGICIGPDVGSSGAAAYLRQPVFVADVLSDPKWVKFKEFAAAAGLRAAWSSPILSHDGKVLGTFDMYYREVRHPGINEIQLIDYASGIAGIAIEQKRAEEKLRQDERELRQLIDLLPQHVLVLDGEGSLLYANQMMLDYNGHTLEEMQGAGSDERHKRDLHPDDLERARSERRCGLASGVPFEVEKRMRGKDGRYRWFLFRYNPLVNEQGRVKQWFATATDIENLKQIEEKLREDEREFRRITDAIPQAIVVQDPSGVPLYANQATLDYTGLTSEDVVAPDFRERIFHPDDLEKLGGEQKAALGRGLPFEIEQRALRKDGQYRWFLIRYNPFRDEQGRVIRWYATGNDIDDRKRNEDRLQNETVALREEIVRSSMFEEIVGSSEPLRKVLAQVSRVAPTDSTVLIQGETGTGKELIARAIHNRSKRVNRAFIRVNCAVIPPSLIASELFGHEKGSFTGAQQRRLGRFESADGGTLFLDEVGELPPETQVALLRVLQEREFERVGGNQTISVDVRVLAASNRDLGAAVAEGTFRRDLFYRLNVFPIQVPALRDRVDDIPLLLEYLVERYAKKAGKRIRSISKDTLSLFRGYDWPGNIRELQNVVERAVILCDGETFCVDPSWLTPGAPRPVASSVPLVEDLAEREKVMIENALRESGGLISGPTGAAAKLRLPRQTLESKIRKLGIDRHRLKTL